MNAREIGIKIIKDAALSSFVSPGVRELHDVKVAVEGWAEIIFDQIAELAKQK